MGGYSCAKYPLLIFIRNARNGFSSTEDLLRAFSFQELSKQFLTFRLFRVIYRPAYWQVVEAKSVKIFVE